MMRILKFGGKSLSSIEKTQKICKYIQKIYKNNKKLIIVVSAIGNTTDLLLEKVKTIPNNPRELDVLLSCGETISASIFAMILNSYDVPAQSLQSWQIKINSMGEHQNSLITSIDKSKIESCLEKNIVPIITGFQAVNKSNDITTLGRGGSDTTATALGATFQTNVEFYSDFNGVFSCDPRHINTKKLSRISLNQLDFMSSSGAKVISNRSIKIAKNHNLTLYFKSSSQPFLKGTFSNNIESNKPTISINQNICEISIDLVSSNNVNFFYKSVFFSLKDYKIYNLTQKSNHISLLINQSDKSKILEILVQKFNL